MGSIPTCLDSVSEGTVMRKVADTGLSPNGEDSVVNTGLPEGMVRLQRPGGQRDQFTAGAQPASGTAGSVAAEDDPLGHRAWVEDIVGLRVG